MKALVQKLSLPDAGRIIAISDVHGNLPYLRGLLDKLGLGRQTLTTAPYKDAGSMLEPLTAEEKAYFQGVLKPWSWALWTSWAASRPRTAGWPMSARCPWTGPC